ncbi:MAG: hypothetical protein WC489_07935 [Patescibacteria group bacterium]|nr:hypothetical protein [Methanoregulaceae archaeon]
MPPKGTHKTHRVPVKMTENQYHLIAKIRNKNPQYDSNSAVILAGLVHLARVEGVLVG